MLRTILKEDDFSALKQTAKTKKSNLDFAEPKNQTNIKFANTDSLGDLATADVKHQDLTNPIDIGQKLDKKATIKALSKVKQPVGSHEVMRNLMNKISNVTDIQNIDQTPTAGETETPAKPVTPENLPSLINKSVFKATGKEPKREVDVNWMQVKNLPGYAIEQIRGAFRPLFDSIMNCRLEDINVSTNLGGMSADIDMKQLIGYIMKFGLKDDNFSLEAFDIDPKMYHIENASVYNWNGVAYLLLKEKLQGNTAYYVYSGPGRETILDNPTNKKALAHESIVEFIKNLKIENILEAEIFTINKDHAEDDKKSMFGHNYDLTKFTNGKSSDMIKLRESIKLLEFNVVNQQEVDSYLDKIATKTNIPEVKNWIKKNIRTYIINNQELNKLTKVKVDKNTPIWVRDAVNRGDALYKFNPNNEFTGKLEHILDWLNSEQAKEYINKLQKVTFEQAVDLSDRWTQTLIKKASSKEDEAGIKDIMQLPNGYKIVQVISAQALEREGKLMQHCVGSYAKAVAKGNIIIYSLRDSKNEPHCTIEVESNRVEQIKGKQNNAVVEKYMPYVKLFLNKIKLDVVAKELRHAKLIKINGQIKEIGELPELTELEQLAAVKQDGLAIYCIKNPCEAAQLAAVEQNPEAIIHIKNPTEAVQLVALKHHNLIRFIKNPTEAVQLVAVRNDGDQIRYIKNPSEAVQLAAVEKDGWAIQFIENPSEAVQLAAIENNLYGAIQNLKNPCEAAQLAAVKEDPYTRRYIKNKTPKVLAYLKSLKK